MAGKRVITVSQLRCACIDPAWRRRWCAGENRPTMIFKGTSEFPVQGVLFHTLVEQFTDWLIAQPVAGTAEADETHLWKELYDRFAVRHLDKLIDQQMLPSAHHLSRALEWFCRQLAQLRRAAGPNFKNWHDIFLTREYEMTRVEVETRGGSVFVSGRPDAVRHVFGTGLEVVDYKLSRGSSLKEDLLQLAAYAHLLRVAKPGLRFSGVLEYYEPSLYLTAVSEEELDGIWRQVILPVLEEIAACRLEEREVQKSTASAPERVSRPDVTADQIEKTYANFQLSVRVIGKTEGPQLLRYRVEPGQGVKVSSLANRAEDLQVALHLRACPLIQAAPGCVTVDLPKAAPEIVFWRDVAARLPPLAPPLYFPIGVGVDGETLVADFSDPNTCHALVAGVAGSGKSEFLKSMAAFLIRRNTPANLRLFLVDPKAVTFAPLAKSRHLARPIMTDLAATIAFLEEAVTEMDGRYLKLAAEGHENLGQRGADAAMPYWIIVFDEFADLILSGRKEKQLFESLVARLAQKGRAAGMHVILATQRPDRRVVTGLIKGNLPLKVCLRVTSAVNSQIVLDNPGAETLLGKGDLLCDRGRGLERAQSPFITAEELRDLAV